MKDNNVEWRIEYTLDDNENLSDMSQRLKINCADESERKAYEKSVDSVFDAYLENYGEACQVENKDDGLNIERILTIDFSQLSDDKKEEMGYESKEDYLIAQLEFAGYQCE